MFPEAWARLSQPAAPLEENELQILDGQKPAPLCETVAQGLFTKQ
jgi:hypothetical protein